VSKFPAHIHYLPLAFGGGVDFDQAGTKETRPQSQPERASTWAGVTDRQVQAERGNMPFAGLFFAINQPPAEPH
jgi:hypothetical protein